MSSLPLVDQQALSIRLTTGLSVGTFCGADGVDDWTEEEWRDRISKHQVLVLIHQVWGSSQLEINITVTDCRYSWML